MLKIRIIAVLFPLCSVLAQPAFGQTDALDGEDLAQTYCASCHNTEPNGPFKRHPPSFAAIAVYRSVEQMRDQILFSSIHSDMPRMGRYLTPETVDLLIAYLLSLEAK